MQSASSFAPEELIGRCVAFVTDNEHETCWHQRVGLRRGVVLKPAQTLAQKAELLGPDEEFPPHVLEAYESAPRVWVKSAASERFPQGCEAVIDLECLLVLDPGDE